MSLPDVKASGAEWPMSMSSKLLSPKLGDHINMSFGTLASASVYTQAGLGILWVSII